MIIRLQFINSDYTGYPPSINNSQHRQHPNPSPLSYGVNGVVVLPPVSSTSIQKEYGSVGNFPKNQWLTKSFDSNEMSTGRNMNHGQQQQQAQKQAPRAEFDSMSNLSSNSSNTSISNNPNIQLQQQPNQRKSTTETSNIPLFQELDPLNNNKKRNSPSNFGNFNVCSNELYLLLFFFFVKKKILTFFFSIRLG